MADSWKALDRDDRATAADPRRRVESFTALPGLAERAPHDNGASPNGESHTATPGLAGHRALAALAAELAQAATVDEGAAESDEADGERVDSNDLSGSGGPVRGGGVSPDPGSNGAGLNGGVSPVVGSGDPGVAVGDRPGGSLGSGPLPRLPLPGSPTSMRLSDPAPSGPPNPRGALKLLADRTASREPAEQSTIALRRRPISDMPASVAPAPPDPPAEPQAGAAAPATARTVPVVEAWSAREDDILPRRQVRRARPGWRRR
jgi:hypothetical protein